MLLFILQSIVSMVAPQMHNVDIEDMAPNSGATIQKGLRKVAVYKDSEGKKHSFSALCPHLGCLLQVRMHLTLEQASLLTCLLINRRKVLSQTSPSSADMLTLDSCWKRPEGHFTTSVTRAYHFVP